MSCWWTRSETGKHRKKLTRKINDGKYAECCCRRAGPEPDSELKWHLYPVQANRIINREKTCRFPQRREVLYGVVKVLGGTKRAAAKVITNGRR